MNSGKKIAGKNFLNYFTLKVPLKEFGRETIEQILNRWSNSNNIYSEIKNTFLDIRNKNSITLFLKSLRANFFTKNFKHIADEVVYLIADETSIFFPERVSGPEKYHQPISILFELLGSVVPRASVIPLLKRTLSRSADPYFIARVIEGCLPVFGKPSIFLGQEDIRDIASVVSKKMEEIFILNAKDIFQFSLDERLSILGVWASNCWLNNDNVVYVSEYLANLMKGDSRIFLDFIGNYIARDSNDYLVFDVDAFARLYKVEIFESIARNFLVHEMLSALEVEKIELFLKKINIWKNKILFFGTGLNANDLGEQWSVVTDQKDLDILEKYRILILFLHEKMGTGQDIGIEVSKQRKIESFVKNGGKLIAFHDVLFRRNRVLSDNICGHFNAGSLEKDVDVFVKKSEEHPINIGINDFTVLDEFWFNGAKPIFNASDRLHILFTNKKNDPLIWLRDYAKGEVLVISLGHREELIKDKNIQKIMYNAINYFSKQEITGSDSDNGKQ